MRLAKPPRGRTIKRGMSIAGLFGPDLPALVIIAPFCVPAMKRVCSLSFSLCSLILFLCSLIFFLCSFTSRRFFWGAILSFLTCFLYRSTSGTTPRVTPACKFRNAFRSRAMVKALLNRKTGKRPLLYYGPFRKLQKDYRRFGGLSNKVQDIITYRL